MSSSIEVPAWAWWGKRSGLQLPPPSMGENGRPHCRWCRTEVPKPRRSWCSNECVRKYEQFWSWAAIKVYVKTRDGGTCKLCGTTEPTQPPGYHRYDLWDVDHIIPVRDGGTDDPGNLRLLCIPCHIEVGYEQRRTTKPEPHPDLFGPPRAAR